MPAQPAVLPVASLDKLARERAAGALAPCCASRRWLAMVGAGRPYGSLDRLVAASDAALAALAWADVEEALAAHPRIGARSGPASGHPAEPAPTAQPATAAPAGPPARADHEAAWSVQEQRGAAGLDSAAQEELRAANVAYEQRFGHVFLICATGKSAAQMLAALRERLGHEPAAEREVVRAELREIVALRLAKAFR